MYVNGELRLEGHSLMNADVVAEIINERAVSYREVDGRSLERFGSRLPPYLSDLGLE